MCARSERGFGLVEIIIVVVIAAILMAAIIPMYQSARKTARQKEAIAAMNEYARAIAAYKGDSAGKVPMSPTTDTWPNQPAGWKINRGPLNPLTGKPYIRSGAPEITTRSLASGGAVLRLNASPASLGNMGIGSFINSNLTDESSGWVIVYSPAIDGDEGQFRLTLYGGGKARLKDHSNNADFKRFVCFVGTPPTVSEVAGFADNPATPTDEHANAENMMKFYAAHPCS